MGGIICGSPRQFHFHRGISTQGLGQAAPGEPIQGGSIPLKVGLPKRGTSQADQVVEAWVLVPCAEGALVVREEHVVAAPEGHQVLVGAVQVVR